MIATMVSSTKDRNWFPCCWRNSRQLTLFLMVVLLLPGMIGAATINASSCAQTAVQSALAAASVGDTVVVPGGSCSWSGLTINKAIHLSGAGIGVTNITINGSNTITKQSAGIIRISGFSFLKAGGGTASKGFVVNGSWRNAEPVVIENNDFKISDSGLFLLSVAGGVIIAKNSFTGGWDDSFIQPKEPSDAERSWATADTMGTRDTSGKLNHYIEENTFYGGTNQGIDADDSTRVVYRYNTLTYSSFNSHGLDTSSAGVRHWEVYHNTFRHDGGSTQIANQSWAIWIRGGTGVIFNNSIADLAGSYWGNKNELNFSIRGAEDARPQGSCSNVSYPVPRQLGQSHNGTSYIRDPIYIWGNTGATAGYQGGWNWGNPCGLTWADFYQSGRDYYFGTVKPGYTPYPYPHPLRSSGAAPPPPSDTTAPTAPSNLSAAAISANQINLTWTAGTDNVGVTGYEVERCSGSSCANFSQVGTPTTVSYSDGGLASGTTYRYRVRSRDAAGNVSGYSSIANATTQANGGDTVAPSAPSALSATAASSSQINLAWTASTDNIGVSGYRIERCQGSSCTGFSLIASPTGTSYSDTGLSAGTTYRYRVNARDAAGNLSNYSVTAFATTLTLQNAPPPPLPEGDTGIAAQFVGDSNIQAHPDVILADDFESYGTVSQITGQWSNLYQQSLTRIATEPGNVFSGTKALEFRIPQQSAEVSNELVKTLSPSEEVVFVRAYTKFDSGYNALGSNHNGIVITANYSDPGVPANGTNKFYVDVENSRESTSETSPGMTNFYVYHPEQRTEWGDHWYPDGRVTPFDATPGNFGSNFVPRPNFTPELNRWYCYELMVKANTPGQRDGRIAFWVDGRLVADYPNVRLRDVSTLRIDKILLSFHIKSNTLRQNLKWYDNVVVARSYIGPIRTAVTLAPPSALQTGVR